MNILVLSDNSSIGKNIQISNNKDWIYVNDLDLSILELEALFIEYKPNLLIYINIVNNIDTANTLDSILLISCNKFNLGYLISFCNDNKRIIYNINNLNVNFKFICLSAPFVFGKYNFDNENENYIVKNNSTNEINNLIHQIYLSKMDNIALKITYNHIKHFYVSITDIYNIIKILIKKQYLINNDNINLCENNSMYLPVNDIVNMILALFNFEINVEYIGNYSEIIIEEKEENHVINNLFLKQINYKISNFNDELDTTVQWFLLNFPKI